MQAARKKSSLLRQVSEAIAPPEDAVGLELATKEEKNLLLTLKMYCIQLSRIDTTLALDIVLPELPASS